jgi:hypothetical protein
LLPQSKLICASVRTREGAPVSVVLL